MNNQPLHHDFGSQRESVSDLVSRLIQHSTILMRHEIDLVKQEFREQFGILQTGAVAITVGAVLCLLALMTLCAALVIALTVYMSLTIAALSVGIALGLIGGLIAFFGLRHVKKMRIEADNFVH